jgi:hypothetical protein
MLATGDEAEPMPFTPAQNTILTYDTLIMNNVFPVSQSQLWSATLLSV